LYERKVFITRDFRGNSVGYQVNEFHFMKWLKLAAINGEIRALEILEFHAYECDNIKAKIILEEIEDLS